MDQESLNSVIKMVEKFSAQELGTRALTIDEYPFKEFPKEILVQAKELGLFKFLLSEAQGGIGGSPEELALLLETISQTDAGFAGIILSHSVAQFMLLQAKKEFNPERLLCFPLYLDPGNLEPFALNATKTANGKLKVSGKISSLPGAGIAEGTILLIKEPEGLSWFYVEFNQAGIKLGEKNLTLGLRTCAHRELVIEGLVLEDKDRLGEKGSASQLCQQVYGKFYPGASAILVGLVIGSACCAMKYGLERYQGGDLIANYEQMRFYYGRMLVSYYTLKASLERIVAREELDEFFRLSLKILAGELSVQATIDGVQLLGGYGYMHDYGQEKRMRDARQACALLGLDRFLTIGLAERMLKTFI